MQYEKRKHIIKKTLTQNQQPKIDNVNTNINNRTFLVGPSVSGKTYLMFRILSRIPDREIYITSESPLEQYSNAKIKKKIGEDIKSLNYFENGIIIFDDILGENIDQFFIRGRHNNIDIYYRSQFCFDLPKRSIRNNSQKIFLFNQTLKYIENIYRDVGGYDMSYDEFRQL